MFEEVLRLILDVFVLTAKISRPGGKSLLVAETLLLRQQLLLVRRKNSRAPRLTLLDRLATAETLRCRRPFNFTSASQSVGEQLVRRILRKHYFTPLGPGPSWLSKIGIEKLVKMSAECL
ncbi:hypothetical protein WDW37_00045 [Bdellovibrionota bacterium FG-1]